MPKLRSSFCLVSRPFWCPDHDHGPIFKLGKARDHRGIVGKAPVAMQLQKIRAEHLDVIQGVRPLRMAGQQDALPGVLGRAGYLLPERHDLLAQALDLFL